MSHRVRQHRNDTLKRTRFGVAFFALAFLLISAAGAAARQEPPPVWIGIQMQAEKDVPAVGDQTFTVGLRVVGLPYGSPAGAAGVILGDLIVALDGRNISGDLGAIPGEFRDSISKRKPGDEVTLRIVRDASTISAESEPGVPPKSPLADILRDPYGYLNRQPPGAGLRLTGVHERKVIQIKVRIETRPAGIGATKRYDPAKNEWRDFTRTDLAEERLANDLIDALNLGEGYRDLRKRLGRLSEVGDPFRSSLVAHIQNNPFQLRPAVNETFSRASQFATRHNTESLLALAASLLDAPIGTVPPLKSFAALPLQTGLSFDGHLEQLVRVLGEAEEKRREAFVRLSDDDRKFLNENADSLLRVFAALITIDDDTDQARRQRHVHVLDLAAKIDYPKLFQSAAMLWRVSDDRYLDDLESAVRKAWEAAGRPEGVFIDRPSAVGKILVGGSGSTWYQQDAAIVLDLGGNDFYTNNAGSPRGPAMSEALLIDFAGNDSYEATFNWTQGAALLGNGMLIDRRGDDQYVGQDWAQGAAAFGTALLLDESGNDVYRGTQYSQGVAAFGIGLHLDLGGDDVFEAHFLSQAVGMPGGAGWIVNVGGNDRYYAKGTRPTSYGDAGIFDSWSQACGVGFRGWASGGIALLLDTSGRDRYEAGNFSQGGGYYFGIGMLRDGGGDNDIYIGSRYNQAFAAHQAVGFLEDEGGDDSYTTRHAVAQSIAWDESIAEFVDRGGNDTYEGGASFSQGASAQNGFAVFLDLGGRNRFVYGTPQGSAGPNEYHGGTSFSLFVAVEDRGNSFTSKMKRSSVRVNGESGLFVDLTDSLERAVTTKSWRTLIEAKGSKLE